MRTMKLSAPDWCFFPEGADPDAYYRKLKAMGFDTVLGPNCYASDGVGISSAPEPAMMAAEIV